MAGKDLGSATSCCRPLDNVQVLLIGWWVCTGTLVVCLGFSSWEHIQVQLGANVACGKQKKTNTNPNTKILHISQMVGTTAKSLVNIGESRFIKKESWRHRDLYEAKSCCKINYSRDRIPCISSFSCFWFF